MRQANDVKRELAGRQPSHLFLILFFCIECSGLLVIVCDFSLINIEKGFISFGEEVNRKRT